jgi:cytoskeleton protein RodZ
MTSERAEQGATPDNHHAHPGATLAAQREAMGWTIEQVAEQLKLAVRQVVAIEKGDYAALPSPAVSRGFVRAYAKILRLDPAPLVAMMPVDAPVSDDAAGAVRRDRHTSFSHSRYPTHGKRSSLPLAWIVGAAVIAAAGYAVWHFGLVSLPGDGDALNAPVETTTPAGNAAAPATDTVMNPSVPLISVPGPADTTGAAATTAPATPAAGTAPADGAATPAAAGAAPGATVPPAAPATAPAATPPATAPAAATTPPAAPAAGANTLVLTVREDSWIEVRPKGGRALVSRLVKAGSTETVEIPGAATLVVGNPAGVSATLRGNAVALPPMPGKTISRVTVQ